MSVENLRKCACELFSFCYCRPFCFLFLQYLRTGQVYKSIICAWTGAQNGLGNNGQVSDVRWFEQVFAQ